MPLHITSKRERRHIKFHLRTVQMLLVLTHTVGRCRSCVTGLLRDLLITTGLLERNTSVSFILLYFYFILFYFGLHLIKIGTASVLMMSKSFVKCIQVKNW